MRDRAQAAGVAERHDRRNTAHRIEQHHTSSDAGAAATGAVQHCQRTGRGAAPATRSGFGYTGPKIARLEGITELDK